jgi:miniconductance mechanosensitive channel
MTQILKNWGLSPALAERGAVLTTVLAVVLAAYLADRIVKRYLLRLVDRVARKTESDWDDTLVRCGVFDRMAHLAPLLVIRAAADVWLPQQATLLDNATSAGFMIVATLVALALLDAVVEIYSTYPVSRKVPISGYVQTAKGLAVLFAAIYVLAHLMQADPWSFFKGLGALTAVLLLVFKDAILGLVASVQISANDLVRIGDWIEMKQHRADGDVIDVGLTVVKVRNWDKTIATIPTYALVSDSFRNWRGMSESGGRRIKRAIHIDMTSVVFCSEEMLARYGRIACLREYLGTRLDDVERWNREHGVAPAEAGVNGRRLTNLGTFRAYLQAHLRAHPEVRQDMTFLVRQLAPGEHGLPIEIYVFCADQEWSHYEGVQADIMDHILAILPEFDLRVFQAPSGADLRYLGGLFRAEVADS